VAVTENVALVAPATTATDAGAEIIGLDDEICRVIPVEGAAADREAVIVDVCPADRLVGEAVKLVSVTGGVSPTTADCELTPVVAVTVTVWFAENEPWAVTAKLAVVAPAATTTLAGTPRLGLEELSVRGTPPSGAADPRLTLAVALCPVERLVGEICKLETSVALFSVTVVAREVPPPDTVNVTSSVAAMGLLAVTLKLTVFDPAGTIAWAGAVASALDDEMLTTIPPVGAAADKVAVTDAVCP
jgi:hypothetical protein